MINREESYAELYFILQQIPYSYRKRVPANFMQNIKEKMSIEQYNKFNEEKVFYKQKFSKETLELLELISERCWEN